MKALGVTVSKAIDTRVRNAVQYAIRYGKVDILVRIRVHHAITLEIKNEVRDMVGGEIERAVISGVKVV